MICAAKFQTSRVPHDIIQRVNDFFLNDIGFAGNSKDYYNPDNSVLHRVLETHRGIPISLGIVYILVGRRLNLPVFGVGAPAHFLVKFVPTLSGKEFYVDVFNGGRIMSRKEAEDFINDMGFSFEPRFLKDSSDLEMLAGRAATWHALSRLLMNHRKLTYSWNFR